ncbi:MAG: hypothetical protein ACOYOT_05840 [Bacteroidales bacterium]
MNQISNKEIIVIKDLLEKLRVYTEFIWSKRSIIAIFGLMFGVLGFVSSFVYQPKYKATLSFAVQENDKVGGLSSLASQFGISLGAGGGGIFGGDNIYEILISRKMIEEALLAPTVIDGKRSNLLNLYLNTYRINKDWAESEKEKIRNLKFPVDQKRLDFSRTQDSIVLKVYKMIIDDQLEVTKRDKKLSIGDVIFISKNEQLSKLFTENLMTVASKYYIESNTKVTKINYDALKRQTDSIKSEYDRAITQKAYLSDMNLNTVRQSSNINIIKKQTDIQVSMVAYSEMKKNLEILKMSLIRQTPLIEIIDQPIYPLKKIRIGKFIGLGVGGFFGGLLTILYFTFSFYIRKIKLAMDKLES